MKKKIIIVIIVLIILYIVSIPKIIKIKVDDGPYACDFDYGTDSDCSRYRIIKKTIKDWVFYKILWKK